MDTEDEETTELLKQAEKIKQREDFLRMESRLKRVAKPKMPRKIGLKRDRTMSRLEEELGELGVDVIKKRMRNFENEQDREERGRKIHVGRSPSIPAHKSVPRDIKALPDPTVFFCKICKFVL